MYLYNFFKCLYTLRLNFQTVPKKVYVFVPFILQIL